MAQGHVLLLVVVAIVGGGASVGWTKGDIAQANNSPEVKITSPASGATTGWNTTVPYTISVTDKEDGSSAYEEIGANEVFLKIKFLPNPALANAYIAAERKSSEPAALTLIKSSDCFNCHSLKAKGLGPSFESLAKKYATNSGAVAKLSNSIINGAGTGTTTEKMPAHPQLKTTEVAAMVRWILRNGADNSIDYLRGLQGAFRTGVKPAKNNGAVYVLTASYRDHGTAGAPQQKKAGIDIQIIRCQ